MSLLIDSDILIEVSRGHDEDIVKRWYELSDSATALLCSPVTIAELWHGARPHEYSILEALFSALICVPIEREVARVAGDYLRGYARSHHVELGDALIAATAQVHDAVLWTRNRKHYPMKEMRFY